MQIYCLTTAEIECAIMKTIYELSLATVYLYKETEI